MDGPVTWGGGGGEGQGWFISGTAYKQQFTMMHFQFVGQVFHATLQIIDTNMEESLHGIKFSYYSPTHFYVERKLPSIRSGGRHSLIWAIRECAAG